MSFNNIFITVGTTQFDTLINQINTAQISEVLDKFHCRKLTIQLGGKTSDELYNTIKGSDILRRFNSEVYRLKPSISPDIQSADLVISHAGAGSCIEILTAGKPLVVVVNETLADNHQIELAQQLSDDKYLRYCTPKTLVETLLTLDITQLKPYEKGNVKDFVKYLDELMGF